MREKLLHCSFCGKSNEEVDKLIKGVDVYICDECVLLCADIVAENVKQKEFRLTIYFREGNHQWFQNKQKSTWQPFFKWFYGREQSLRFTISYNKGHVGFTRESILYYSLSEVDQDNEK